MGKSMSRVTRPLKNWNIESRAHKAISKEKRPSAPTFVSVHKQIELVNELEPDYKERASKKQKDLDENLKKVFVTSTEGNTIDSRYNPDKPLPKDNKLCEPFEYGFYEPEPSRIPTGKITLRQAIEFIGKHSKDPKNYTAEKIAEEYKLDAIVTADILEFYRLFNTFQEEPDSKDNTLALPISMKSGITIKFSRNPGKVIPDNHFEEDPSTEEIDEREKKIEDSVEIFDKQKALEEQEKKKLISEKIVEKV
ncbi:protein NDUFAF4 homolog [Copidosoma floridanum]|uniref:protein NDUFAF4 homolog n=1 Tax=Copidosoma floridanum TaxID=29053 RepID=UPI0006C99FAF|nr:protein NDUFAF4 homolog [Copidosoma floridanum]